MRKFWKLGLIVGIVAFMAGCSNLWDYVPPPRVNNPPPTGGSSGGGGGSPISGPSGSGPTRHVLTFNIKDVSGTTQEVKITVDANVSQVTLSDIQRAFNSQYPGLRPPSGINLTWSKDNTPVTDTTIQYADNTNFSIDYDFPAGSTNYTVTLSTGSAGGNRKFVTTNSDKQLSDILAEAGLRGPDYKPSNPKTGWDFDHWEKVGNPNTEINPSSTDTIASGTNIVAVYNVTYKIKIGNNEYEITVPVTAPNEGATWAEILAAAKTDPSIIAGGYETQLDNMLWKTGSSVADTDSTKRYPANTTFTGTNAIPFNVGGKNVKVPVNVDVDSANWDDISKAAKEQGVNLTPSAPTGADGYTVEWREKGVSDPVNASPYNKNTEFELKFVKNVNFYITDKYKTPKRDMQKLEKKVTWGETEAERLTQIFARAEALTTPIKQNGSTVLPKKVSETEKVAFDGWRVKKPNDTNIKVVRSSEIAKVLEEFPDGTMIKPNWVCQLYVDKGWETTGVDMDFTYFEGGQASYTYTQIGDFYIANTEITRDQWKKVMSYKGLGDKGSGTRDKEGSNWKTGTWMNEETNGAKSQWDEALKSGNDPDPILNMRMPMNYTNWYDAVMFCNMLSLYNGRTPYYYLEYGGNTFGKKGGDNDYDSFFAKLNDLYEPKYDNVFDDDWLNIVVKPQEDDDHPGFRLPSSEYWRYAAHGGKKENGQWLYPTFSGTTGDSNDALFEVAWCTGRDPARGGSGGKVHPVGTKGGDNPLRDMTGNVWEWTEDEYYKATHLYIGGPYDAPREPYQSIEYSAYGPTVDGQKTAGKSGVRSSMGIRIMVKGTPGENYEDYFD